MCKSVVLAVSFFLIVMTYIIFDYGFVQCKIANCEKIDSNLISQVGNLTIDLKNDANTQTNNNSNISNNTPTNGNSNNPGNASANGNSNTSPKTLVVINPTINLKNANQTLTNKIVEIENKIR